MTMLHLTEERLLELIDMKADELFAAIEEIKADPIQRNWVYDCAEEEDRMTITPEEVAKLHLKAMQGDIVPILYRVSDMADLIARMDEALKLADDMANRPTAIRVVAYRTAREKLK